MTTARGLWGPARVSLVAFLAFTPCAWADDVEKWNDALDRGVISRPHTVAELEAGAIVLPSAPISLAQRGGSLPAGLEIGKGDATIQLGMHLLYRATPTWEMGALVLFAPAPTNDTGYGLGGSSGLQRTHTRDYLAIGAELRWMPFHYKLFEGWLGAQAGGVVIADRFTTENAGAASPQIGAPQVNERTEGFFGGGQLGVSYSVSESFVVGFTLRMDGWLLPSTPQCSAIGDCATLKNGALVFEGGFLFGYRLPL